TSCGSARSTSRATPPTTTRPAGRAAAPPATTPNWPKPGPSWPRWRTSTARWPPATTASPTSGRPSAGSTTTSASPAEHKAAGAAGAAVGLAADHRAAVAALDEARAAFGDRRRLDPRALSRALGLPAEIPADLERLQADFLAASRHRAELTSRLDAGAASDLPSPSAPW